MAFCTTCGDTVAHGVNFCPECGAPVLHPQISAPPQVEVRVTQSAIEAPKEKSSARFVFVACALAVVALAIAFGASTSASASQFEDAVDGCITSGEVGYDEIVLSDDGKSLYMDGSGNNFSSSLGLATEICILSELDMPTIILTRMNATNALMGVQTGDWDGISASWTYHPDNGLDVSLSKK